MDPEAWDWEKQEQDDWRMPSTYAGREKRSEWVGRVAWQFPEGQYHLHARYLKGDVQWVLVGRKTGVCKVPGRCRLVEVKNVS